MGRATRWLKSLLGMKKEKETAKNSNENDKREKKRWSFAKSTRDSVPPLGQIPVNIPVSDASWLRNYIAETEKEQSKQAIAVAAATAAAADAAVAAAQAAVAVVRLTSQGRGALFGGGRERWAAVKIQTVFRGFLARKALRALKGLVKLQAHVRGYLVRKQAAATLRRMQSLIRAQAAARYRRARRSINKDSRIQPDFWHRKSMEKFDEPRNDFQSKRLFASYDQSYNAFDDSPKIVEIDTFKTRSRSRRSNPVSVSDNGEDVLYPTVSSPLPIPARISIPSSRNLHDYDWTLYSDEYRISTAQSTPRVDNSLRANAPVTPAKSVCCDSFFRQFPYNYPNYMANTQSFQAKLRSQSAPKQRPEPTGPRKRVSLNEIMAARNSISSVRMQRPCSQLQENFYC